MGSTNFTSLTENYTKSTYYEQRKTWNRMENQKEFSMSIIYFWNVKAFNIFPI